MNIQIYPLDKIVFDNISICFGMEKSAVELALGAGEAIGDRYYYFNSEMAIDYRENKVDFVEFLAGIDGKLKPTIYGVSAFDVNAAELVDVLKANNNGEICDDENGYSYSPIGSMCVLRSFILCQQKKTARPRKLRHFVPSRWLHPLAPLMRLSPVDLPSANSIKCCSPPASLEK